MVVPAATREAKYLFEVELKGRQLEGVFANTHIWMRVRDGFLSADSYDQEQLELSGINLYRIGPRLRRHQHFPRGPRHLGRQAMESGME